MKYVFLLMIASITFIPFAYADYECHPHSNYSCSFTESNASPHQSGVRACHGFVFYNVVESPICGMTNTEIFIHEGQAIDRFIPVEYDGKIIHIIDNGVYPSGNYHEESVSFGGVHFSIPFEIFYHVDDKGTLIHKGNGYPF